jgi:hypothetical protein
MNGFLKLFLLASTSTIIRAVEDVEVIISEMPENMEKFAIGTTITTLSVESDFNKVAKEVIQQMNNRFGKEFVMLIGTNLHPIVIGMSVANNTYLLFSLKQESGDSGHNHQVNMGYLGIRAQLIQYFQMKFLFPLSKNLIKSENFLLYFQSFTDIIESSRKASVEVIGSSNTTTLDKMVEFAKQVLSKDHKNCHSTILSKDIREWCFKDISLALVDAINADPNYRGVYTATVGESNYCSSEHLGITIKEAYLFLLDSLYFQIAKM